MNVPCPCPKKKVSVVIPTLNRAKFLPKAVKSIIDQDYSNVEIIIVDDGSTDNTDSVVRKLSEQYPIIVYCNNTRPKGLSGARNTGILRASGEYIASLDSDDVWLAGHLSRGVEFLEKFPGIDVLFGNFEVREYETNRHLYDFFDRKKILPALIFDQTEFDFRVLRVNLFEALIQEGFFQVGTSITRKAIAQTILFNDSARYAEDRDYAIRLYKEGNCVFAYSPTPLYVAYRHESNLTAFKNVNEVLRALENRVTLFKQYLLNLHLSDLEERLLTRRISKELLYLANGYRRKKRYKDAVLRLIESARFRLFSKGMVRFVQADGGRE